MTTSQRLAKILAHFGFCSRRQAEAWIQEGRIKLRDQVVTTPATLVTEADYPFIQVDNKPLPNQKPQPRLWLYYKPVGLITTRHDPQGRPTVFDNLPPHLPRVISIGRLDINSEGLLLLTNNGDLARWCEHPQQAWERHYRVRVYGQVNAKDLQQLADGITIEGMHYDAIRAHLDGQKGRNAWITMILREGKNREIRRICEHFDWQVNRLIRTNYGPFALGTLKPGEVKEAKQQVQFFADFQKVYTCKDPEMSRKKGLSGEKRGPKNKEYF